MKHDNTELRLTCLEIGFRIDSTNLKTEEEHLAVTLQKARFFRGEQGLPKDRTTYWHRHWDEVEAVQSRMKSLVHALEHSLEGSSEDRLENALRLWGAFESEGENLLRSLNLIRREAAKLEHADRQTWNSSLQTVEFQLMKIHRCAANLTVKLASIKKYSRAGTNPLAMKIPFQQQLSEEADRVALGSLDPAAQTTPAGPAQTQRRPPGLMDVVRAFWMWFKPEGEKASKRRSFQIESA